MPRSSGGGWRQIGLQGSVKSVSRGEASLLASLGWRLPKIYSRHTTILYSTYAPRVSPQRTAHAHAASRILDFSVSRVYILCTARVEEESREQEQEAFDTVALIDC